MRVGLLGGSFDPIHHGHLIVASALVEHLGLAEVRFVPAREQPFKVGTHHATPEHRAAMVAAAIAGDSRFRLETAELERPGASYTVETLRVLTAREPGVEWVLLLGVDAARDFAAWREPDTIRALAHVTTFHRGGAPLDEPPAGLPCVKVPKVELSATIIRARVGAGKTIRYMVPTVVAAYIAMHDLYKDTA